MLFYGFKLPEQDESDVIDSEQGEFLGVAAANLMPLVSGRFYVHKYPTIAFLPILSEKQVHEWNGEAYSALVIATNHELYYETRGRRRPQPPCASQRRRNRARLPIRCSRG